MEDNIVERGRPQIALQYCECALHAEKEYEQTSRIFSNYCFSTARMFMGTHLNVTLNVNCLLVANRQTMTVVFNSCRGDQQELGTSEPRVAY
jgi:hypothetical protein